MLSLTGFLTMVCSGSLLALAVWFLLKDKYVFLSIGTGVPMILSVLIMVRLLIPFELGFEKSLYFDQWLPQFHDFFTRPFLHFGDYPISLLNLLCAVWLAGAVAYMTAIIARMLLHNHQITRSAMPCQPEVRAVLNSLYQKRKSGKHFYLFASVFVETPMLIGLFFPTIVVPNVKLTEKEWTYVLSHELEHYDHRDLWIKLFCECICAVYWWNPLIRVLRTKFYSILEIHNDTVITRNMSKEEKYDYVNCLVQLAKHKASRKNMMCAMPFSDTCKTPLGQRIFFLTETKKRNRHMVPALVISLLISILAFSFVLEPQYKPEGCVSLTVEDTFLVLNQDGSYEFYMDGKKLGVIHEITEDVVHLKIYQSIDEVELI